MISKTFNFQQPFYTIFLQSITLFLVTFVFFLIVLYKIQYISSQESIIRDLQSLILLRLDEFAIDIAHHLCILPDDLTLIMDAEQSFCNGTLSIGNYSTGALIYVDWIPTLQDKIDNNYILYDTICINNLVVHMLTNNINISWPVTSSFPGDTFLNGLPNLCFPGSGIGHSGISVPFQDTVISFLTNQTEFTEIPPLRSILYFPATSIPANVGNTFYMNNSYIQCYQTELYCYGFTPVYLFTTQI